MKRYYVTISTNKHQSEGNIRHNRGLVINAIKAKNPEAVFNIERHSLDTFSITTKLPKEILKAINGVIKVELKDGKIGELKVAVKKGNVKAYKGVDKNLLPALTDKKTKFTYLGTHVVKPGKKGEYIYMVASFTAPKKGSGLPDRDRTWGWVKTEKEARKAVACNAGDMFEMEYLYTVIEKLASGIFCIESEQVAWFAWTCDDPQKPYINGKWVEIPQPEWAKGTVNWTL